jgi:hypothetical protein
MNRLFGQPMGMKMQASGGPAEKAPNPVLPPERAPQIESAESVTEKLARPQPKGMKMQASGGPAEKAPNPVLPPERAPHIETAHVSEHVNALAPFRHASPHSDYKTPLDRMAGKGSRKGLNWFRKLKGAAGRAMKAIPRGYASLKQRFGLGLGPVDEEDHKPHVGEISRGFNDGMKVN